MNVEYKVGIWCSVLNTFSKLLLFVVFIVWFPFIRDRLNNLCRQKEKLEEKIMEHYRKLDSCSTKKWVPSLLVTVFVSKKLMMNMNKFSVSGLWFTVIIYWVFYQNHITIKRITWISEWRAIDCIARFQCLIGVLEKFWVHVSSCPIGAGGTFSITLFPKFIIWKI